MWRLCWDVLCCGVMLVAGGACGCMLGGVVWSGVGWVGSGDV